MLGAFGGAASGPVLTAGQQAAASQFQSGSGTIEVLDGGRSGDIEPRLVMIERATVQFRQRRGSQRWELRVTEVFRRRSEQWHHVHRHADPLVERRGLDDVLALIGR